MPHNRFEWIDRLKFVEREHRVLATAIARLRLAILEGLVRTPDGTTPRDLVAAGENLETCRPAYSANPIIGRGSSTRSRPPTWRPLPGRSGLLAAKGPLAGPLFRRRSDWPRRTGKYCPRPASGRRWAGATD